MKGDIMSLVRANIAKLAPYSTARDEYKGDLGLFLDANESPYETGVNRYPDPRQRALKERLAQIKGVEMKNIFIGNGSDEAIDLCYRVFCEPRIDNVVVIAPSYGMYAVSADTNDVEVRSVALNEDFTLDTERLFAQVDERTKLIFICSPNNPSGNIFPRAQLLDIVERADCMVVVDEAYIDFADEPSLSLEVPNYPNLIVLQTLSKAWGMAGLRVGLAFANEAVVGIFSNVKYPYNISVVVQQLALMGLDDGTPPQIEEIKSQRAEVLRRLENCAVVQKIFPTQANFVLVRVADADKLYNRLIEAGIIVRNRSRIRGCEGCLRITIGTPAENLQMLKIIENYG